MRTATKVLSLVVAVLLLGLTITAAISIHRIQTLSLPISKATSICALILPIITAVGLRGGQSLARRSHGTFLAKDNPMSWPVVVVSIVFTIYETVIATLALTHMAPASNLTCLLERRWQQLFSNKDAAAIQTIQDAHQCCGLNSVVDMAWPFPSKSRPVTACHEAFGRGNSCFGYWRRDEQISAGLLLFVAVMSFLIKVIVLFYARSRTAQAGRRSHSPARNNGRNSRRTGGRLEGTHEGQYRDDPSSEDENQATNPGNRRAITAGNSDANGTAQQHGPVLQASRLHEGQTDQNAWA